MKEELDPKWIRVSSILSMIPSKGGDGNWSYPMQRIDKGVLQKKADLGTSVHKGISTYLNNEFYVASRKEEGYIDSYFEWERELKFVSKFSEKRLFHEATHITGCVDLIGTIGEAKKPFLVDFKCTTADDPIKWPLQAAFYSFLAEINGIEIEKTCYFLQLDPNGEMPKVHKYEITKDLTSTAFSFYNAYLYLTRK